MITMVQALAMLPMMPLIGRLADRRPWRQPRLPERLCHPHVPDPGDHPLVEQRPAEQAATVRPAEAREILVDLADSDDEEIAEAIDEAMAAANVSTDEEDDEEDESVN